MNCISIICFSKPAIINGMLNPYLTISPFSYNNHSEGELSPTGTISTICSTAHEFSVFANVGMQGSMASLSISQMNLVANSESSDTVSLISTITPPELPKRSNSITSLSNNGKPTTLSPRTADIPSNACRSQPIISPKSLGCVNEERTPPHSAFAGTLK